jgi:hypothetical protein
VNQCISVHNHQKSKELWKILKMLRGSSSIFALPNHTIFSHVQTGVTVHLIAHSGFILMAALIVCNNW